MNKPSKRDLKRLARQQNNATKQLNASAPATDKALPAASEAKSIDDQYFAWSGSTMDHEHIGEWSWELAPKEIQELLLTLGDLARLRWREVRAQTYNGKNGARRVLHKGQSVESLCDVAQQRLEELQVATEDVFRLRRGTDLRIWGFLEGSIFHLLWYDRHHKVCPFEND